ncbi:DUF2254 domain-containing protein [Nonlabens xiamenensis]|uniref:DUF2254 domain-containing protein n=1 Tax=Nonlabens xiamenensis TaxID=2341043 RepID=UPI000F608AA1|nr:DUF2254 domain-containing protein [Nonlabens xiamenensis]
MKALYLRIKSFFNTLTSSIAFYPTFYAITAILFALVMKWAEGQNISGFLQENVPTLVIDDIETARNILTTLIASGVSMLVFSFSMVMLLLSQAAANYSPRVLPSLISNRRHQYILGTFLATILYNIITIISIEPDGKDYQLPGFSVLLGILSSITAIAAFVYFIHSISTSIQINSILKNIYHMSRNRLEQLITSDKTDNDFPATSDWFLYETRKSGTIQNISIPGLLKMADQLDNRFEILITKGEYILEKSEMFKSEKELNENELKEVYKNFNYSESELVRDNYVLGFKQITEIGVKAMSPGINDPGTAIDTIDYLTDLIALRMLKQDYDVVVNKDDQPTLSLAVVNFDHLLYNFLAAYRNYCKHDLNVMHRLLSMLLKCLNKQSCDASYYKVLHREASLMIKDAEDSVGNSFDLEVLHSIYDSIELTYQSLQK